MNIKPIGERVLVSHEKEKDKTDSGIYIPEEARKDKKYAIVESVGQMKDGSEFPLKKGEKILYGGYSHEDFEIDDRKMKIIELKDVVAKIEE